MNTSSSPTFPKPLLRSLEDVVSGTQLETMRRTLAALGFAETTPFSGEVGRYQPTRLTFHTWVHPKGVVVAGQCDGATPELLQSVKLSAVVNFGWQPANQASAFKRGATWMSLDGQLYCQANPACDDSETSLLTCLDQLEQEGQLEPFERWEEEACRNVNQWLFALSNEALQVMEREVGADAWLEGAPAPLKTFIVQRLEDMKATNTAVLATDPYKWAEKPLLHVRKQAQEQGTLKPTEAESEQIQRWVASGYKNPANHYDFSRLDSGLTQATVMAHQLHELKAQQRLLDWIGKATVDVLEQVVLVPDATGHTLISLLLRELVKLNGLNQDRSAQRQDERARPIGRVVLSALEALSHRLGPETTKRALERDGNLVGMVAGFIREDYSSSTIVNRTPDRLLRDIIEIIQVLEATGVTIGPTAILASFQRTPEECGAQGDLGCPQRLRAFLENLIPNMDWNPLIAPLSHRHLDAITEKAPPSPRPRF